MKKHETKQNLQPTYSWKNPLFLKSNGSAIRDLKKYLPPTLILEYREAFDTLDERHAGTISTEDICTTISSLGTGLYDRDIHEYVSRVMQQRCISTTEKCIGFTEFVIIMASIAIECVPEDEVLEIFSEFDRDGDGYISHAELQDVLLRLGEEGTDDEVQAMMNEADVDGDGKVSLQEFVRVMTFPKVQQEEMARNTFNSRLNQKAYNNPACTKMPYLCNMSQSVSFQDSPEQSFTYANCANCSKKLESLYSTKLELHAFETQCFEHQSGQSVKETDKNSQISNRRQSLPLSGFKSSLEEISSSSSYSISSTNSSLTTKKRKQRRRSITRTLRSGRNALLATARSLKKSSK